MSIDACCNDAVNRELSKEKPQKPVLGFKKIEGGIEYSCYNNKGVLIISRIYEIPERIVRAAEEASLKLQNGCGISTIDDPEEKMRYW